MESWDGRHLYYSKAGSMRSIRRVPVAGGEEALVAEAPDLMLRRLCSSRTGLYFPRRRASGPLGVTEHSIHFLDSATGHVSTLLEEEDHFAWPDISVSPDEEWVLYAKQPTPLSELMLVENFR